MSSDDLVFEDVFEDASLSSIKYRWTRDYTFLKCREFKFPNIYHKSELLKFIKETKPLSFSIYKIKKVMLLTKEFVSPEMYRLYTFGDKFADTEANRYYKLDLTLRIINRPKLSMTEIQYYLNQPLDNYPLDIFL